MLILDCQKRIFCVKNSPDSTLRSTTTIMDEQVPEDHAAAILGLKPSRIWADCGSDNVMAAKVREFLIELRFKLNLAKTCAVTRVPDTEIFFNPWNPRNHAKALLKLDRARVFLGSLKNNAITWQVLIFISQTLECKFSSTAS